MVSFFKDLLLCLQWVQVKSLFQYLDGKLSELDPVAKILSQKWRLPRKAQQLNRCRDMFQCLFEPQQAGKVTVQMGEDQDVAAFSVAFNAAGGVQSQFRREQGREELFLPVGLKQQTQLSDTLSVHGNEVDMGIDTIKAQIHAAAVGGGEQSG